MDPKLEIGDVVTFYGKNGRWIVEEVYKLSDGQPFCKLRRGQYQVKHVTLRRIHITGTVHRPTPEGLVQVWPEVKDAP